MKFGWSDLARTTVRPFRTFRAMASDEHPVPGFGTFIRRPIFYLFFLGAAISLTTAGRLVAVHIVSSMLAWSFLAGLQILAVALVRRVFARQVPVSRAVYWFFASQGPWLLFFAVLAGICLFSPHVYTTMTSLLSSGILPIGLVVIFSWSILLTFAFLRAALDLTFLRAFLAFLLFYVVHAGGIIGYFLVTDQMQPLMA